MNNIMFTCCRIMQISDKGKYKILSCKTKVPKENGELLLSDIFIYIESTMFEEKNSSPPNPGIMAVGKDICVTGKTVCEIVNNKVRFNVLIENKRKIDIGRKTFETNVKLFDITIQRLISTANKKSHRCEFIGKYSNSDDLTKSSHDIIVSVTPKDSQFLRENTSYNVSGKFFVRVTPQQKILPVIETKTFVKDVPLTEGNVRVIM